MYKGYNIVCNTAAGRRRYMQYLIPFVVASDLVDRYDIWVNTTDNVDIEFFKRLSAKYPQINLVYQPDGVVDGIKSINAFYKSCVEENTIYIKLDDDVIWMEDDFFRKMLDFRIENPHYFLVSPLVINNAICTYIMQIHGRIKLTKYVNAVSNHRLAWKKGTFAVQIHNWFFNKYLKTNQYPKLYCQSQPIAMNRFSINSILWFGSEMKAFNGEVLGDDEEFMSCIKPTQLGKENGINGNVLISHFAFRSQRELLDRCKILDQYGRYLHSYWKQSPKMSAIDNFIQQTMQEVNANSAVLYSQNSIYRDAPKTKKAFFRTSFKKYQKAIRNYWDYYRNIKYIVE